MQPSKKRAFLWHIIAGAAAVLLIILLSILLCQTHALREDTQSLLSQINGLHSSLQSEISNGISGIHSSLEEKNSIFSFTNYETGAFDSAGRTLSLKVEAAPKVLAEDTRTEFVILCDGQSQATLPGSKTSGENGFVYSADAQIPLCDNVTVLGVIDNGGVKQVQTIAELYDLHANYLFSLDSGYYNGFTEFDPAQQKLSLDGSFALFIQIPYLYGENQIKSASLVAEIAGEAVKSYPVEITEDALQGGSLTVPLKEDFDAQVGTKVQFILRAEDTFGFHYHKVVDSYTVGENGEITYHHEDVNESTVIS